MKNIQLKGIYGDKGSAYIAGKRMRRKYKCRFFVKQQGKNYMLYCIIK